MAADEQQIAGEDDTFLGKIDEQVSSRMGGPRLHQLHLFIADLDLHPLFEGPRRGGVHDIVPVEVLSHHLVEELRSVAELVPVADECGEMFRWPLQHFLGGCPRGDDLGAPDQLIAECMIAVRMRVHQSADGSRRRNRVAHGIEHFPRQPKIEQCVDQEIFLSIDDQAGIAPAPAAIRLEVGMTALADIVQALGEPPACHLGSLLVFVPCGNSGGKSTTGR